MEYKCMIEYCNNKAFGIRGSKLLCQKHIEERAQNWLAKEELKLLTKLKEGYGDKH